MNQESFMYKNSLIYLASSVGTILLNFISLPFFTQFLSLSDYGIVALYILFGVTITSFFSLGLSQALFRFYFKYDFYKTKIIFSTIFIFVLTIFVVLFFLIIYPFSTQISSALFNQALSSQLVLLSYLNGIFVYFFHYNKTLMIAEKKAINVSALVILQGVLNLSISFYFVYFENLTFLGLILGSTLANLITLIVSAIVNIRFYTFKISILELKRCLIYSYPESPGIAIGLLYNSFDKFMITNVSGLKETGVYDFGFRFATILKLIMDAFGNTWGPLFMKNMENNSKKSVQELINKFYQLFFIFGFFAISISFFTEEALIILTTEEFYIAKYLVPMLVVYYFASTFTHMSIQQIYFSGKLIYNLPVNITGLTINLFLNIILIPHYGAFGAAIATISASFIQIILNIYIGNRLCPIQYNVRKTIQIFIIISSIIVLSYPIMFFIDDTLIKVLIKIFILIIYVYYVISNKLIYIDEIYNEFLLTRK